MRLTLRFGKHYGRGRLSPEQQAVVERLERGETTAKEAEKLLGGSVRVFDLTIGTGADPEEDAPPPEAAPASAELSEEEIARRLVERIAQEVDAETSG